MRNLDIKPHLIQLNLHDLLKLKNLYSQIIPIFNEYGFKPPSAGVIARDLSEKIELSITLNKTSDVNVLILEQNTSFENPNEVKNGTINIIKKILDVFIGNTNYKISYNPKYIITLEFKNIERYGK